MNGLRAGSCAHVAQTVQTVQTAGVGSAVEIQNSVQLENLGGCKHSAKVVLVLVVVFRWKKREIFLA